MTENKNKNFVYEIYVENIPARFIISALSQIKETAASFLLSKNLPHGEISVFGTYRRLVLFVENIPQKTAERSEIFYGPPARLLKDEKGNYTKQASGFASSLGISCDKLKTAVIEKKGEVLCYERKLPPLSASKILSDLCVHIVKNLQFPKNMVWEESRLRFARPIRNFLAIYGSSPVVFRLAQVKAGKTTFGLAALGSKKISVKTADSYFKSLEKAQVIVKGEERKEKILKDLKNAGSAMKLSPDLDEALVEENSYLTEYPSCVPVKYSNEFLSLPQELLSLVMKKQLKFFPCYKNSQPAPFFIGVRDGLSKGNKNVEEGFLSVFEARCRDAIFFYENDIKTSKDVLKEKISKILFQEKLGTMSDKKERTQSLALWIADKIGFDSSILRSAAQCVYLDLASNVVREFPELQGIMSGYYGKEWGLDEKGALALKDFYKPLSAEDSLPSSLEGSILSLASRIDTLAGDFSAGLIPTGSQDPHGLRRAAYGAVRIIAENKLKINLKDAVYFALSLYKNEEIKNNISCWPKLADFFWQRLENYSSKNIPAGALAAVKEIFLREGDLNKALARAEAIKEISQSPEVLILASLYKRVNNILKDKENTGHFNRDLFEKEEERTLADSLEDISAKSEEFAEKGDYKKALQTASSLKSPLENFFAGVMVNCENKQVRDNRTALLFSVKKIFGDLADLSQLTQQ
ncbi:MAG: glycine--tRNA ligase subunit beta [Elusimicrobia bacterium]|nr:glycine--tRNA ligase subunit beta [Elusimicrobiota bacterium]